MQTQEEVAAQAAAKEAQAAEEAEAARVAAEAEKLAAEKAAKENLTAEEYKALLEKSNKDRSAANKEAQAAKKREEALAAKVKKYEDEKKTEAERLEARAKEAEEKAAKEAERATFLEHKSAAQDAGVLPQYREFAVSQFVKAEEEDPAKFFKTFKETHPAMFNGKPPAQPTAKGGANAPVATDEITRAIAEVEEKIKKAKGTERVALTKRLKQLQTQKGAAK